jgi:hypothetical protein
MTIDLETFAPFEAHTLPDGSVIFYRDSDHCYVTEVHMPKNDWIGVKGTRLTSVTTAVKPLDFNPDALIRWAVALANDGIDWREERDARAQSGTNVHKHALYALATGRPLPDFDALTEEERGYALGVQAFWHEHEPAMELAEQIVYSRTHRVVGRADLFAWINGKRVLMDAKTSASQFIPAKHHGQLALYDLCAEECGVGGTDEQWILVVRPDGSYEPILCELDHGDALAALHVYRAAQKAANGTLRQRKAAA